MGQLWMIEKVGHGEDDFEIVNCQSNFVWDQEWSEVKLRFGKQSSDQLFKVEKVNNGCFWFKTNAKGNTAVALEGVLRHKDFDPNAINQLFYIVPVNNCNGLDHTSILINNHSGKALDVPGASFEHGKRLIAWEKNKRFNQRWRWVDYGGAYLLQSVLNGHCVDIAAQAKEPESDVIQWDKTGGANQRWRVIPQGQGLYRIESVHASGQFLAIHNNDYDNGGKIEINNQGPSTLWRIEGHVPH